MMNTITAGRSTASESRKKFKKSGKLLDNDG